MNFSQRMKALAKSASEDRPKDFNVDIMPVEPKVFVGWFLSDLSAQAVSAWCLKHNLVPMKNDEYHVTIIYSKGGKRAAKEAGEKKLNPERTLTGDMPRHLERFSNDHSALVIHFEDFPDAAVRHNEFLALGLDPGFPEYHPHMTLTYAAGELDPLVMADLARDIINFDLVFDREVIDLG